MNIKCYQMILILLCWLLICGHNSDAQNSVKASSFISSRANPLAARKTAPNTSNTENSLKGDLLAEKLRLVLPQVKRTTKIPVLLPSIIPQSESEQNVCIDGESNRNMYRITISEEPECSANAHFIAVFKAERNAVLPEEDAVDKVILLADGIEGFYTAKSCGASCAPPQIELIYRNVLYTFQFGNTNQIDELDEINMIEMVNSAINFIKQ